MTRETHVTQGTEVTGAQAIRLKNELPKTSGHVPDRDSTAPELMYEATNITP